MKNLVVKKIGSGVLAFVSIFSLLFAVLTWAYDKKPNLSINLLNSFNVLEVKKDLPNLIVLYNNEDLERTDKQIITQTFSFQNSGNNDILQSMFDQSNDWGIEFSNCELISASISSTSNAYLRDTLHPEIDGNRLKLNKIILEKKQSFVIEVMLITLKDANNKPIFYGKIAGINCDNIIINENQASSSLSFFEQLLQGNLLIHFTRFIIYATIFIVLFFIVLFIIAGFLAIQESYNKWFRKKNIKKIFFLEKELKWYGFFVAFYMNNGKRKINGLIQKCRDRELINKYFDLLKKVNDRTKNAFLSKDDKRILAENNFLKKMYGLEAIIVNNENIDVNPNFITELKRFMDYLF